MPLAAALDPTVSPIPVLTPAITAFPIQIPTGTRIGSMDYDKNFILVFLNFIDKILKCTV